MDSLPVELLLKILEYLPPDDVVQSQGLNRRFGAIIKKNKTRFRRPPFKLIFDMQKRGVRFTVVTPRFQGDLFIGEHASLEGTLSHLFCECSKEGSRTKVLKVFVRWLKKYAAKMNEWGDPLLPSFDIPEFVLDLEKLRRLREDYAMWIFNILRSEDVMIDLVTTISCQEYDPVFVDENPFPLIKQLAMENVAQRFQCDRDDICSLTALVKNCFNYFSQSTVTTKSFEDSLEIIQRLYGAFTRFCNNPMNIEYRFTIIIGPPNGLRTDFLVTNAIELIEKSKSLKGDHSSINGPEDIPKELLFEEGRAWIRIEWIRNDNGSYIAKIAGIF